jgi:hypothetical protein
MGRAREKVSTDAGKSNDISLRQALAAGFPLVRRKSAALPASVEIFSNAAAISDIHCQESES